MHKNKNIIAYDILVNELAFYTDSHSPFSYVRSKKKANEEQQRERKRMILLIIKVIVQMI